LKEIFKELSAGAEFYFRLQSNTFQGNKMKRTGDIKKKLRNCAGKQRLPAQQF
jgi:hypothetical protein